MAGYSGTPLPQKLGIEADHRVALLGAPPGFTQTLGVLPDRVDVRPRVDGSKAARQALEAALARSKKAHAAYARMSPSHRKEWLAFIEEAKRPETRDKRIRDVVRRIAEAG
jgi:hypothetical protein